MRASLRFNSSWISLLCVLVAWALLMAGFLLAGGWRYLLVIVAPALIWWIGGTLGWRWLPSALLVVYLFAAVGGVVLGAPASVLVAGATFALAGWELSGQGKREQPLASPEDRLLEQSRLQLLVLCLGLGLLVAELGLLFRFSIPFGGLILAGLFVLYCLYRFFGLMKG